MSLTVLTKFTITITTQCCGLLLIFFLVFTGQVHAFNQMIAQGLNGVGGSRGDLFGNSISVSGGTAVIGAKLDDDWALFNSGAAYVFVRNESGTWRQQQKLIASDGKGGRDYGDLFGSSVSVSGDTAVIGAPYDDDKGTDSGSVYVFNREGDTWRQQQKLIANDGAALDQFGSSVSVSGDTAVIGAFRDDDNGTDSGSVYVFKREGDSWIQQQKLTASDGASQDLFGYGLSVSDDTAVIGAFKDDDNGTDSGSVYVFKQEGDSWIQQQKLAASDGASQDSFGYDLSVSDDTAVIGAFKDDEKGSNSGSAYVFQLEGDTWIQQQKLTASDGEAGDKFGFSVSVSGDRAVIGAGDAGGDDDDRNDESGSVYVFVREDGVWTEQQKLMVSDDGVDGFWFGDSVSVSGNTAMISAYRGDASETKSGSVYVFDDLPSQLTQVAPIGTIESLNPTFEWTSDPLATQYFLWIYSENRTQPYVRHLTPDQVNCVGALTNCTYTPAGALGYHYGLWWVTSLRSTVYVPWSEGASIYVTGGIPAAPNLVSPNGPTTTLPTFVWDAVPNAQWYYIYVIDGTGSVKVQMWVNRWWVGCQQGTGQCSMTSPAYLGSGTGFWIIIPYNPSGFGPTSSVMTFQVP